MQAAEVAPAALRWSGGYGAWLESRLAIGRFLRLLKVRMIHALLVTLLVVLQYWFQLAAGFSDQPRMLGELFVGLFTHNVMNYMVAFAIIALVQQVLAPGGERIAVLVASLVAWVFLITESTVSELWTPFIVVELGLVTSLGVAVDG